MNVFTKEEWGLIRVDFKKFYEFLNNLFNTKEFFRESMAVKTQSLIEQYAITQQIVILSEDKAKIYLHYLKPSLKR